MEHDGLYGGHASDPPNFAFAFNDSNFSDRILRFEIMACPPTMKPEDGTSSIADWARNRKRRRDDAKKDPAVEAAIDFTEDQGEQIMVGYQQEADEVGPFDSIDDEPVAMLEESSPPTTMLSSPAEEVENNQSCASMCYGPQAPSRQKTQPRWNFQQALT